MFVEQIPFFKQGMSVYQTDFQEQFCLLTEQISYLTEESAYSIYSMMILPLMTYRSTVQLCHSETKKKMLRSLERRAASIIGVKVPAVLSLINKEACCLVKKCLNGDVCTNFNDYFVVNNHQQNTRNGGFLLKIPKSDSNSEKPLSILWEQII